MFKAKCTEWVCLQRFQYFSRRNTSPFVCVISLDIRFWQDTYPTSPGGKCVTVCAMLLGVLVVAFPVSVFSDLWSKELKFAGLFYYGDTDSESEEYIPLNVGRKSTGQVQKDERNQKVDGVMMPDDITVITEQLRLIDESQEKIRSVLRKYRGWTVSPIHKWSGAMLWYLFKFILISIYILWLWWLLLLLDCHERETQYLHHF